MTRPRMLVDKSKKTERISSEEVANAIEIFKREGGLIRELPDQTTPLRDRMVYPDKSLARMGYISLTEAIDLYSSD
ncbi:MAG TPA: hypothetical protein VJ208_02860 [Candidatus Nanoarchaeia archaeon]|nr:hypothetical protein [Candidatus Nanoarchaeia archaeon]